MDFKAALKSFAEAWAVAQIQTLQGTSSSSPFLPPTAEIVSKLSASTSKPPTPAIAPKLSVVGQSGSSPPTENLEPEKKPRFSSLCTLYILLILPPYCFMFVVFYFYRPCSEKFALHVFTPSYVC